MTERDDLSREVQRILSMSDADVEAEIRARGESPKAIADRSRSEPIMTDPKEVADLRERKIAVLERLAHAPNNLGAVSAITDWIWAADTALQSLSSELERVKGERDQALEAEDEAKDCFWAIYPEWLELSGKPGITTEAARTALAARAERAEASLGVAVKALASAADAAKSFRDESGDAVAEQVLLRISPALASIQAKGE